MSIGGNYLLVEIVKDELKCRSTWVGKCGPREPCFVQERVSEPRSGQKQIQSRDLQSL